MNATVPPEEPYARVTLAAIYDLLLKVQRQVAALVAHRENDVEDIREMKVRIAELEAGRWPLRQIAALATVATVALTIVGLVITVAVRVLLP